MTKGGRMPAVAKEGVQQVIRLRLTDAVLRGELAPGTRLSPAKIAEEFGSSHIPVREALASPEASGHVVRKPRVGYFVAELPLDQLQDLYRLRSVLEDEAHRVAIEKLEPSDIEQMKLLNRQMVQAVGDRTGEFVRLNREFHFIPFRCTGNLFLSRFLEHLWDASARYQNVMEYAKIPPEVLATQHDALIHTRAARCVRG